MPKRKNIEKFAVLGEKDCWHSYGLQILAPAKFSRVVGQILTGKYALVTSKFDKSASSRVS